MDNTLFTCCLQSRLSTVTSLTTEQPSAALQLFHRVDISFLYDFVCGVDDLYLKVNTLYVLFTLQSHPLNVKTFFTLSVSRTI